MLGGGAGERREDMFSRFTHELTLKSPFKIITDSFFASSFLKKVPQFL